MGFFKGYFTLNFAILQEVLLFYVNKQKYSQSEQNKNHFGVPCYIYNMGQDGLRIACSSSFIIRVILQVQGKIDQ